MAAPQKPILPSYLRASDDGPLRLVGFDDDNIDTSPDRPDAAVVRFTLSREFTRFERVLFDRTDVYGVFTVDGRELVAAFHSNQVASAVHTIEEQLRRLESDGRTAKAKNDAVVQSTLEELQKLNLQ